MLLGGSRMAACAILLLALELDRSNIFRMCLTPVDIVGRYCATSHNLDESDKERPEIDVDPILEWSYLEFNFLLPLQ